MSVHRTAPYRIALIACLTFTIFAVSAVAASLQAADTKPAVERVTADTPRVTAAGATFTVPAGWSIETRKDLIILTPPETDTHVAIFDAQAADAKAAVAAAWAAFRPEAKRPIKLVTPRPAREGWDERQIFDYETSPNERAAVQALALRAGTAWTRDHSRRHRSDGRKALRPDRTRV